MATKKYEVGGMTEAESCGKPGKPRCKQKFKSKGKSKETKGSILGTLGAIAGGLGGYAAYKKLKEQQKGGTTKYQKGGSAPHGSGSMTHGTVPPMMAKPDSEKTPKEKRQAKRELKKTLKYVSKKGPGYNAPESAVDTSVWKERPGRTPDSKKYQKGGTTKPTPKRTTVPKKYVDSAIPTYKGPDAPMPKTARAQKGGTPMAPPMPSPRPKTYFRGNEGTRDTARPQIPGKGPFTKPGIAKPPRPSMNAADFKAKVIERYGSEEAAREAKAIQKKGGATYKTGGMVNPNAKLQAAKSAGSKGVKSGVNPKAAASKVARGRSGGTSAAPKTAVPKAKYGMSITKMKKK